MAKGNMIVTLVAQTKKFQDGLQDAGKRAMTFGSVMGTAMNVALGALGLLTSAVFLFLPNFIKMGEEARKSELRLGNIAKQMGLFGNETDKVTKRVSKYAEELSFVTGVDDEMIRSAQAVMLTFANLAKSADKVGGPFDRATKASVDLAAAGFGGVEENAVRLGKALQDPIKGITALTRVGVTLTDEQKKNIEVLVAQNDMLSAQDVILKAIETQVGGTAEATASATERMSARFESVAEELSLALLPAVDDIAEAMIDWLDSVDGKKAIQDLTDQLIAFGDWIASPNGKQAIDGVVSSVQELGNFARDATQFFKDLKWIMDQVSQFNMEAFKFLNPTFYLGTGDYAPPSGSRSSSGAYPGAAPVTVNVNGITPTASVARTVQNSLNTANRLGMR